MTKHKHAIPPSPALGELLTPSEYRLGRERFFQCDSSLEWAMRQLRPELNAARALVKINGRNYIRPDAFDRVLVENGERSATGATAGCAGD